MEDNLAKEDMYERPVVHDVVWDDRTIQNFWDLIALDTQHEEHYFGRTLGPFLVQYARKRLRLESGSMLDYGCGPGFLFDAIREAGLGVDYTGVDTSERSLSVFRERWAGRAGPQATYQLGQVPPELEGSFDHVWCSEVVEHLSDEILRQVVSDLFRYTRSGGYVLVSTPHDENLDDSKHTCPECGCRFHRWQHMRSWSLASLRQVMEDGGFQTVSCEALLLAPWTTHLKHRLRLLSRGAPAPTPHLVYIGRR